jgi:tetratricopeptide (TPR) repeat protein
LECLLIIAVIIAEAEKTHPCGCYNADMSITTPRRRRRQRSNLLKIILALVILAGVVYFLPPVRERVDGRLYMWRLQLISFIHPPEKEVFVPQQEKTVVATAVYTVVPTITETATQTTAIPAGMAQPDQTLTPVSTPNPPMVSLKGVRYMDQHGIHNYCAPSTLGMALSYWGWNGTRTDVGKVVKPYDEDYNVMPYELANYAKNNAGLQAVTNIGGTVDLLKTLVAGGFPVQLEIGEYQLDLANVVSWMGHYILVTGYDDAKGEFIVQDAYLGQNQRVKYAKLENDWRNFNFLYLIVYSADKQPLLQNLMGPLWDENTANRAAYDRANLEIGQMTDINLYYAWFNRGTAMVKLQDYSGAAQAYDQAFAIYQTLPEDTRPYRMVWYQTGPYQAYYYAGRYQDLVNLADLTLGLTRHLGLEESNYWRAMGYAAIGKRAEAIADLQTSLEIHPNFEPSVAELQALGVN